MEAIKIKANEKLKISDTKWNRELFVEELTVLDGAKIVRRTVLTINRRGETASSSLAIMLEPDQLRAIVDALSEMAGCNIVAQANQIANLKVKILELEQELEEKNLDIRKEKARFTELDAVFKRASMEISNLHNEKETAFRETKRLAQAELLKAQASYENLCNRHRDLSQELQLEREQSAQKIDEAKQLLTEHLRALALDKLDSERKIALNLRNVSAKDGDYANAIVYDARANTYLRLMKELEKKDEQPTK